MKVFKYPLGIKDGDPPKIVDVDMPIPAEIMGVGGNRDGLVVWARVDTSEQLTSHRFYIKWTGDDIRAKSKHVGTVTMPSGLVYHVFVGEI